VQPIEINENLSPTYFQNENQDGEEHSSEDTQEESPASKNTCLKDMVEVNGQKEIPNEGAKESETVITKLKKQGRQQFFRLFIARHPEALPKTVNF
jgi:hypothetical protein